MSEEYPDVITIDGVVLKKREIDGKSFFVSRNYAKQEDMESDLRKVNAKTNFLEGEIIPFQGDKNIFYINIPKLSVNSLAVFRSVIDSNVTEMYGVNLIFVFDAVIGHSYYQSDYYDEQEEMKGDRGKFARELGIHPAFLRIQGRHDGKWRFALKYSDLENAKNKLQVAVSAEVAPAEDTAAAEDAPRLAVMVEMLTDMEKLWRREKLKHEAAEVAMPEGAEQGQPREKSQEVLYDDREAFVETGKKMMGRHHMRQCHVKISNQILTIKGRDHNKQRGSSEGHLFILTTENENISGIELGPKYSTNGEVYIITDPDQPFNIGGAGGGEIDRVRLLVRPSLDKKDQFYKVLTSVKKKPKAGGGKRRKTKRRKSSKKSKRHKSGKRKSSKRKSSKRSSRRRRR